MVKLSCYPGNVNIIQVYDPTSEAEGKEIETCCAQSEQIMNNLTHREITVVRGDFNAVGKEDNNHGPINIIEHQTKR